MILERYSEIIDIPCHMFDCSSRLRPASFMDIAQELAAKGSAQMGFDDPFLAKHGLVWILARMSVRFDRMPVRFDRVTAETWHRGLQGMFFIRDYRLLDPDGSAAVSSVSSWVLMDKNKRSVLRSDHATDLVTAVPQNPEAVLPTLPAKVAFPRDAVMEKVGEHTVTYSDLDYNGHANNAKYTVWAMDCLQHDLVLNNTLKEITVNFNHELRLGQTVELMHVLTADGSHIIEGTADGFQAFIARLKF